MRAVKNAIAFTQAINVNGTSRKGGTQDPPREPPKYNPFPRAPATQHQTCGICAYCEYCDPQPHLRNATLERPCWCNRGLFMLYVAARTSNHVCASNNAGSGNPAYAHSQPVTGQTYAASPSPPNSANQVQRATHQSFSNCPPQLSRSSTFAHYSTPPQSRAATGGASDEYYRMSQSPPQPSYGQHSPPPFPRSDTGLSSKYPDGSSPQPIRQQSYQLNNSRASTTNGTLYYSTQQWPSHSSYEGGSLPQQGPPVMDVYTDTYYQEPDAMPGASNPHPPPQGDNGVGRSQCGRCNGRILQ